MLRLDKVKKGDRFICKLPQDMMNSAYLPMHNANVVITKLGTGINGETTVFGILFKDKTKSEEKEFPPFTYSWMHYIDGSSLTMANMHKIETTDIHKALSDLDYFLTDAYTKEKDEARKHTIEIKAIHPIGDVVYRFYVTYNKKEHKDKLDALNDMKISLSFLKFNLQGLVNMRIITPHAVANATIFLNNVYEQVEKWEASILRKMSTPEDTPQQSNIEIGHE